MSLECILLMNAGTLSCVRTTTEAKIVLHGYAMNRIYGTDDSEYQEWQNKNDKSQTASVQRVLLLK